MFFYIMISANFGGIIGLFLGASLLSAIELLYYFTLGLYIRLHKQFEQKYRKNKRNTHRHLEKPKMIKISTMEPIDIYKY